MVIHVKNDNSCKECLWKKVTSTLKASSSLEEYSKNNELLN